MKKGKKLLSLLLCLALVFSIGALGLTACNGDDEKPRGPFGSTTSITVQIDKSKTVQFSGTKAPEWSIEDDEIASVKPIFGGKSCTVTGKKVGKTRLIATLNGKISVLPVTVTEAEVVYLKIGADEVNDTIQTVEEGKTVQLVASTNLNTKKFKWSSNNDTVAGVSSKGLVNGIFPGRAVITCKVDGDDTTYAQVTIDVTEKAGSHKYLLLMSSEGGTKAWIEEDQAYSGADVTADTFFMWHTRGNWGQPITFKSAPRYADGVVSFNYTSTWNPGLWTGMQLFYKNSNHTAGKTYKLNCKINVKSASLTAVSGQDEQLDTMKVTLNENVIELKKGVNNVEVYYVYTAPLGSGGTSSFDLQMGWADPTHTNGWFVQNADVEVSDVEWSEVTPIKLEAPSFTFANGKATVTDNNEQGRVKEYLATFYQDDKVVGSSTFAAGDDLDTNPLNEGTYKFKIQAVGVDPRYTISDLSESEASVVVTEPASYRMTIKGAIGEALAKPGTWSYFNQWYVSVKTAEHVNRVTTLEFSNNDGEFDTLQLYYKNSNLTAGKNYQLSFDLRLTGDNEGGNVTINGTEVMLKHNDEDDENDYTTYKLGYTEVKDGASFAMLVAIYGQNTSGSHEITAGKIQIKNCKWEDLPASPAALAAPQNVTATVEGNQATVSYDAVDNARRGYEIGFFKEGSSSPSMIISAKKTTLIPSNTVALTFLPTGKYTVKVRAKGDGLVYATDGAWGASATTFEYTNPKGDVYELPNNNEQSASNNRGKWTYWAADWIFEKDSTEKVHPTYSENKVHLSFSNNAGDFYNLQLFIDPEACESGKTYEISLTFNVQNALITDDGNKGGENYNPADSAIDSDTFKITAGNKEYELQTGEHTYKFTFAKSGAFQILFGINGTANYHRLSAADITISGLVVTAK